MSKLLSSLQKVIKYAAYIIAGVEILEFAIDKIKGVQAETAKKLEND